MKTNEEIIEEAIGLLDDSFEPIKTAYFVTKNGDDEGGDDFCIDCIKKEVKACEKAYKEARQAIIDKYKPYKESGKYSDAEIKKSLSHELEEYPVKVKFSYEGHDPDFCGGRHSAAVCEGCGEYFETDYYPDLEEANYLLESFTNDSEISPPLAWQLRTVFSNFDYKHNSEVEQILLKIAKQIIKNDTI